MKFGYVLPRGSARFAAETAQMAEEWGWDGFFVSESVWGVDAWVSLADEIEKVRAFERAGATWWIESNWALSEQEDESILAKEIARRLRLGPPKG
mgnify:CR=1 FL=1